MLKESLVALLSTLPAVMQRVSFFASEGSKMPSHPPIGAPQLSRPGQSACLWRSCVIGDNACLRERFERHANADLEKTRPVNEPRQLGIETPTETIQGARKRSVSRQEKDRNVIRCSGSRIVFTETLHGLRPIPQQLLLPTPVCHPPRENEQGVA